MSVLRGDAVLVINAGSASLKVALLDGSGDSLWRGQHAWSAEGSMQEELARWLPETLAPWSDRILLVGHRIVHGGDHFTAPTLLDGEALQVLEALVPIAPLHNGPALRAIHWIRRWRPELPQWACFDTAFHSTLPEEAFTYALPEEWRQEGFRRYGFHGLNHQHVRDVVQAGRGSANQPLRLISCHLGGGCSLCAIRDGRSVATSMGFTPLEGLVMATRSGSIDPGILLAKLRRGMDVETLGHVLQSRSGLLGLSGLSADMRELRDAADRGHAGADLAIRVFRHRLLEEIGAMAACLGGLDVLALTGGIGEHDEMLFGELRQSLSWLPPFEMVRVPADEEGLIARSCREAAGSGDGHPRP